MALIVARAAVAFTLLTCAVSATLTEKDWTKVARCRTKCVTKFVDYPLSDNKCTTSTDCFMCWQMCEKMVSGTWSYLCEPSRKNMCPLGCRTACDDAIFAGHTSATSDHTDWSFTHPGQTKAPSHDRLLLAWQRPRLHGITDEPTVVILYIVMWRHGNNDWKYMYTTSELWAQIDGRHSEYQGLAFHVLAVTDNGKIAETSVTYPPKGYTPPVVEKNLLMSLIKKGHHATQQPTTDASVTHQVDSDATTARVFQKAQMTTASSEVPTANEVSEISATREGEDQSGEPTTSTEQTTSKSETHDHGYNGLSRITTSVYVSLFLGLCAVMLVFVLAVVSIKHHRSISRLMKLQTEIQLDMHTRLESNTAFGITDMYPQFTQTDQPVGEHSIALVHTAAMEPAVNSHSPVFITLKDLSKNGDISLTCTA